MVIRAPKGWVKADGRPFSAEEVAAAVRNHARKTGTRIDAVQAMVDQKVLVPGQWSNGNIHLFYDSPDGL